MTVGLVVCLLYGLVAIHVARHQPEGWEWFMHTGTPVDGWNFHSIATGYLGGPMVNPASATYFWQQRALYPLLAALATLGNQEWLPFTLVLVNVLAAGVLAGAAVALLGRRGLPAWYGLGLPLSAGGLIALLSDVADLVLVATLALGWLALTSGRLTLAAVAFAAAVITKETAWLFVLPLLLAAAWHHDRPVLTRLGLIPPATYLGLLLINYLRLGEPNLVFEAEVRSQLTWPFGAFFEGDVEFATKLYGLIGLALPAVMLSLFAIRALTHRFSPPAVSLIAGTLLLISLSGGPWANPYNFTRLVLPIWLAGLLWLADRSSRIGLTFLAFLGPVSLLGYGLWLARS